MTALSADKVGTFKEGKVRKYKVAASTTIYKNSIVAIDADGFAIPADDAAGLLGVVGFAVEARDNSSGSDGDLEVPVISGVSQKVAGSSLTAAMVNTAMMAVDDQTVAAASVTTNDIPAGVLERYESASLGWLFIPLGGTR